MIRLNKILCFFITILIVTSSVYGLELPKKKIKYWDLNLSLSSFYDNNILKNSDKYLERFKNNEDEGRFHINRYDDLVMEYDLKLSYTNQFIKKLNTILSASAGHNAYSFNSEKTWSSFSFGLQQYLAAPTTVMLSYSYIPEFYVKHYRDDDWVSLLGYTPETFQPFSFSKNDFSLWIQHSFLKTTKARVYFSYLRYFHNEHFTEYDSDNLLYGLRLFHTFTKTISADAGYRYITSDAKGYDEPGENKLISDDGDASYNEQVYFAGIDFQLPRIFDLKNSIALSGQFSKREYTTSESRITYDLIHPGREDYYYSAGINYNIALLNNLSLTAFFRYISRDSGTSISSNDEYLSSEKDYTQSLAGLSFNYKFNF